MNPYLSKLFVLISPGDLTSGSDNVTSVRYELPLESPSNFRSEQRREKNKTFPICIKELETLHHGGMSHAMICQQLSVSRSQLHVWLKRDQIGVGLQTQPGRDRETVLHPAAKRVIKMGSKKCEMPPIDSNYPEWLLRPATGPPLDILPFILKLMPKPTEKQRIHCLKFTREHVHWSEEGWQKLVWLDKSPFEVFHPPDRHSPTTTVRGWPEARVKLCCERRNCFSFSSLSWAKIAKWLHQ